MAPHEDEIAGVSFDRLKEELERIHASNTFAASRQSWKLLQYLYNKRFLNELDEIKESTIAIELYQRTPDFDEKKDSIVRVEAHRLRKRLSKYYEGEGAANPIRIELLPGSYIIRWKEHPPEVLNSQETPAAEPDVETNLSPIVSASEVRQPTRPPGKKWYRYVAVVGAAALLLFLAFSLRRATRPAPRLSSNGTPVAPHKTSFSPAVRSGAIRILAGSPQSYTDRQGREWQPDKYFNNGIAENGPKDFFGKPDDAGMFQHMRIGEFSYAIPAPPGSYELRLYFAEPEFRNAAEFADGDGENERRFNISLNGHLLLENFDIASDSGFAATDVRAFRVQPGKDGFIRLRFEAVHGAPLVNAIELVPYIDGKFPPIRVRASELSYTDPAGHIWSPDHFFFGGRLAAHQGEVKGTPFPELYASERYGYFGYAIPVPPGRYAVTLHFAETWWSPNGSADARGSAGARVFDVSCNGVLLLHNLDIFQTAGPFQAIEKTFHNLQPNGQGKLLLLFTPLRNYASVRAIEVRQEEP